MSLDTRKWMALTGIAALAVAGLHAVPAAAVDTDMAISTTAIDFGSVRVGSTAQAAVTLTHTGGDPFGPINIFGGAPPTAEFNASQTCQGTTLPAGGSCTVNYSFAPGSAGAFNDTSSFTISETNDQGDGEDFSVSLSGTGRAFNAIDPCQFGIVCVRDDLPVLEIPGPTVEPPAQEPPEPTFALSLQGIARVKAGGFKSQETYLLQLNVDTTALTFLAMDGAGKLYSGNLAPKNRAGTRFALFLDASSASAFAADVMERGTAAAGPATPAIFGSNEQLIFKQKADGSASLRIKSSVLVEGIGEITFGAKLLAR